MERTEEELRADLKAAKDQVEAAEWISDVVEDVARHSASDVAILAVIMVNNAVREAQDHYLNAFDALHTEEYYDRIRNNA